MNRKFLNFGGNYFVDFCGNLIKMDPYRATYVSLSNSMEVGSGEEIVTRLLGVLISLRAEGVTQVLCCWLI